MECEKGMSSDLTCSMEELISHGVTEKGKKTILDSFSSLCLRVSVREKKECEKGMSGGLTCLVEELVSHGVTESRRRGRGRSLIPSLLCVSESL